MNARPNPLSWLAPRTSPRQCAQRAQNSSIATPNRMLRTLDYHQKCYRLTLLHLQRRKTHSQNLSPEVQILFNIHNPI